MTGICGGVRYSFATVWPIQLNEVTPGLQEKLCPTDCRLRPDQRFTELGMYDEVCPVAPALPPPPHLCGLLHPMSLIAHCTTSFAGLTGVSNNNRLPRN